MFPTLKKAAPSDRLRIAHIGLGGMGNNHMGWFAKLPEVEIVALCDLDQVHLNSSGRQGCGLISYRLGRKREWNAKREKFVRDREANSYLAREYRSQWELL